MENEEIRHKALLRVCAVESASSLDGNVPRLNILADRSRFFKGSRVHAPKAATCSWLPTSEHLWAVPWPQQMVPCVQGRSARAQSIIIVSSPPIVISKMRGLALQLPDNPLFLKPLFGGEVVLPHCFPSNVSRPLILLRVDALKSNLAIRRHSDLQGKKLNLNFFHKIWFDFFSILFCKSLFWKLILKYYSIAFIWKYNNKYCFSWTPPDNKLKNLLIISDNLIRQIMALLLSQKVRFTVVQVSDNKILPPHFKRLKYAIPLQFQLRISLKR